MYISVFYVFYNPFSIKNRQIYSLQECDKRKKALFEPTRVGNTAQLELEFLFIFLIFWLLSKNKKTHGDSSSLKKINCSSSSEY